MKVFCIVLCCIAVICATPVLLTNDDNQFEAVAIDELEGNLDNQELSRKTRGITIGFGGVGAPFYPGYGYPATYAYPAGAYSYGYSYPVYASGFAHFGGYGRRGWGGYHGWRHF